MNQHDANKAVYQRWMAAWPAASGSLPYVFDNDVADENARYARVSIEDGTSVAHTMGGAGNRLVRRTGEVVVDVRGPGNAGRKELDQLASAVRTVLEYQRLGVSGDEGGVTMFASSAIVEPTDGHYWILVVTTPFEYYELR
jgi:hypothetical protein